MSQIVYDSESQLQYMVGNEPQALHTEPDTDCSPPTTFHVDETWWRGRLPKSAQTWLVKPNMKVCAQHRRVDTHESMSLDGFKQVCKSVWSDMLEEGDVQLVPVRENTADVQRVPHRFILVQHRPTHHNVMLLSYAGWPILNSHRAILYRSIDTVHDLVQVARIANCNNRGYHCALHPCDSPERVIDQLDQVDLHDGAVACLMVRFEASEDELSQDGTESDAPATTEDGSTTCPESHVEDDSDDEVTLMTTNGCITSRLFDDPFQRAREDWDDQPNQPDDMMVETNEITFLEGHQDRIDEVIQQMMQELTRGQRMTAVTFGLGVASLGRRDLDFTAGNVQDLLTQIAQTWRDHLERADAEVLFVTPQPVVRPGPNIVLIVAFQYVGALEDGVSRTLVFEDSDFVQHQRHPYAAIISTPSTNKMIAAQLGIRECFPSGIRDCEVVVGEKYLEDEEMCDIPDGALVDTYVGPYPEIVSSLRRSIVNVEKLYIDARAQRENRAQNAQIIVRVRGVSPRNRSLGHRDIERKLDDLATYDWVKRAHTMWPFGIDTIFRAAYVTHQIENTQQETSVFHLIVSYARGHAGVPVLVKQTMCHIETEVPYLEQWAIMIDPEFRKPQFEQILEQEPFWWDRDILHLLMRNGWPMSDLQENWKPGGTAMLRLVFDTNHAMLGWRLRRAKSMPHSSPEAVTLLQTKAVLTHNTDIFQEVCNALLSNEEDDLSETDMGDGCQTEHTPQQHGRQQQSNAATIQDESRLPNWNVIEEIRNIVQQLNEPGWVGLNTDSTNIPDLRPAARWATQTIPFSHQCSTRFHVYTDGSCKGTAAAWSFAIICEWYDCFTDTARFTRVGFSGDALDDSIGPYETTPADAEATAIIAAAEFLMTRSDKHLLDVHFHFDATGVGFAATGEQNLPKAPAIPSYRRTGARIMLSLLQRTCKSFAGYHVHAHQGQPHNEFVDSVASLCRKGWTCAVKPQLRSGTLLKHEYKAWAWLEVAPDDHLPGLETILANDAPLPDRGHGDKTFSDLETAQDDPQVQTTYANLRIGSANVGTLGYDSREGSTLSLKANELMRQFDEAGYVIVAIQESRARTTQVLDFAPYCRLISAAKKGLGGVEIWLSKDRLENVFHCAIDVQKDLLVWSQDERHLAVHLTLGSFQMDLLAVYAPQKGRSEQEIQEWWAMCNQILEQRTWEAPLFLLGDMNCRIGSVESAAISSLCADLEDIGGACFRELCDQWSLIVPSTFTTFHVGPSATFTGTRGQVTRNDCIAIPAECTSGICSSSVDASIDLLNRDHDHATISLELQICWQNRSKGKARKGFTYDRQAARQVKTQKTCTDVIAPEVAWNVDINEHWDRIRDAYQTYAKKHFTKPKRQKRQNYMSDATWQILCDKKDTRQLYMELKRAKKRQLLREIFDAWRHDESRSDTREGWWSMIHKQEALLYEQQSDLDRRFCKQKCKEWKEWPPTECNSSFTCQFGQGCCSVQGLAAQTHDRQSQR